MTQLTIEFPDSVRDVTITVRRIAPPIDTEGEEVPARPALRACAAPVIELASRRRSA